MRTSIYPWDVQAWRTALRTAGIPGFALLALLLGTMIEFSAPSTAGPGHSSTAQLVFVRGPLCLLALLLLLFRPRVSRLRLTDTRFGFLAFGLLYLISTLWSAEPVVTLGKSAEIVLAVLTFLEVSRSANALQRVEALKQIILLTISLIAVITVTGYVLHIHAFVQPRPGLFTRTTAQAPFLSGNGLGYVASALFLVIFAEWQAGRIRAASAFSQMAFALLVFSVAASRTSFAILILSVILVIARKSKIAAVLASAALLFTAVLYKSILVRSLQGNESSKGFASLSGRTVVWAAALRTWQEHPFLGVGGGVGGKVVVSHIADYSLQQMSSLHNGFMELLTGLGSIGFLIGMYLLLQVTWRVWKSWEIHPEYSGTYVLIVHAWLTTIMSTGVFGWMGYEMAFFLCILTNIDLVQRVPVMVASAPFLMDRRSAFAVVAK